MIYDIRTSKSAQQTLETLTKVPANVWEQYLDREKEYEYIDDLVADVIQSFGELPKDFKDFQFIYFHITTSANRCKSFIEHGILDLQKSYMCKDSELRTFLDAHHIKIDLDNETLIHNDKVYSIHFGPCPKHNTTDYHCWSIGRKFYYDYTTCGFLSVWDRSPYGGYVHRRPEILMDIDNLLGLHLSQEWATSHLPYQITAKVSGNNIVYCGDDDTSNEQKVISYLTQAYTTAFGYPHENILLLKNGVQIPPKDILEVKPLDYWK